MNEIVEALGNAATEHSDESVRLTLVLGDQLDRNSPALRKLNPRRDVVLMLEVHAESTRIPVHKARIAQFLAAMRHFARSLIDEGYRVDYRALGHAHSASFETALKAAIQDWSAVTLNIVEPGEFGVRASIQTVCSAVGCELNILEDDHFLASTAYFQDWRAGRKKLVMEYFYRQLRRDLNVLMDGDQPKGGQWNFDRDNRKPFGKQGPGWLPEPLWHEPDELTRATLSEVARTFAGNPGSLAHFRWAVTREQALASLEAFIEHRLPAFGPHQDAMWTGEAWLYHSQVAAAMNLKLLNPREVIDRVVEAHDSGLVPIASAEGFIRQVIGWREYVRGVYWSEMPDYLHRNALGAENPLPDFYWSADTEMRCLRETISQTWETGYAHHIQRLMVTGLFALLNGSRPFEVHEWYLSVYVDAVEWVEAPNTLGMSQFADGGLLASKPYVASGQYINRMSNYCQGCPYDPKRFDGPSPCPFTVLYWDFLMRHEQRFAKHPRASMQWRMLGKRDKDERLAIRRRADELRGGWS